MTDDEWICWNYETGFSVIAAKDKDDAVLKCEMDQPIGMEAALLGEEREIKENMWELLGERRATVTKLLDKALEKLELEAINQTSYYIREAQRRLRRV